MKRKGENGKAEVDALAARILAGAKLADAGLEAWRGPQREIKRLLRRDYVQALQKCLGRREVESLVAAAAEVLPEINCEPITVPKERCAEIARKLSVHLSTRPYRGPEGLALRGFYVHKAEALLSKPLIYVNTAHHPAAVSATFGHEIGHHLAYRVFHESGTQVHFFLDADYAAHLDDPIELAADVLVSLGGYPRALAQRIFGPASSGAALIGQARRLTGQAVTQICQHLKHDYRLDFTRPGQPSRNLTYLGGMVHYAKLRWALLAEYDL